MSRGVLAPFAVGLLGVVLTIVEIAHDSRAGMFGYIAAFAFFASTAVGALFLVLIAGASRARWFLVLRRGTAAAASTLPLAALAVVPILIFQRLAYPWSTIPADASPSIERALLHQQIWNGAAFFTVRTMIYFAVWIALAELLRTLSRRQGSQPSARTAANERVLCAVGLPLVGFTGTFAAFDWFMSLTPAMSSDVFGVYFLSGAYAAGVGLTTIIGWVELRAGLFPPGVGPAHFHALGRLLLVGVIFWTYIAFVQLLLVWIGDLQHEIPFYVVRIAKGWAAISAFLLAGHFIAPFFLLLSRPLKRRPGALAIVGAWILIAHAFDVFWIVIPAAGAGVASIAYGIPPLLAMVGLAVALGVLRFRAAPPVPERDPELLEGLRYESP